MEVHYLTPVEYHFKYPDSGHYKEYCEEFYSSDSSSNPYGSDYYSSYSVSTLYHHVLL